MPKVLHVIPYMAEASGGPPVVVQKLTEGAENAGWTSKIVTSPDYSEDRGRLLAQEPRITVLPSQLKGLLGKWSARLDAEIARADILHCHTLWSPLVTRAAALARSAEKPYVMSPHGMLDPYSFGQKRLKKRAYLEVFERRALVGASRVLFTTGRERDLAVQTFGEIPNAAVATLGADCLPQEKAVLREQFFAEHPDLRGKKLLLFLGRIHPKKRPELLANLIKAIQPEFPNAMMLFAGTGEPQHVAQVAKLIEALNIGDKVRFLGHVRGNTKASLLAAADLFLLPSRQENFAIAVAEALHAGTPVILTRKVNIWQEIEQAEAGIALSEDDLEEKLVEAVLSVLIDPNRKRNMAINACKLAQNMFTWDAACSQTFAIYEDVLAQA